MIGGNPNEFLDSIYNCSDTIYIYEGKKYWSHGWMLDEDTVHMEVFQYNPSSEDIIWEYNGKNLEEALEEYVEARIFDGKTFWEVEHEIEWVDA